MRIQNRLPPSYPGPKLKVQHFGPLVSADVQFGAMTVLVGPQATGKSIFLQLLKLLIDTSHIKYEFRRAGIDWEASFNLFLDIYFGEGMRGLWHPGKTRIFHDSLESLGLPERLEETKPRKSESMFFVPAQRVLTMRDGWPQPFTNYDPGIPYTVREFSEELRQKMAKLGTSETLFPVPRRLKEEFRKLIQKHIFPGFNLEVNTERGQKRMVLAKGKGTPSLPFMVWSAGQREFVPLLLGLSWLLTPAGASRRQGIRWVVIEELEMGLHPQAISVVLLMLFELVARGYRVCISTHSPQVLDAVWALRHLKENHAPPEALLDIFDAPKTSGMINMAKRVMGRSAKVHYFDRSGQTRNISTLDPASEEIGESGWGGLSEFSGRANTAVARAVANAGREKQR